MFPPSPSYQIDRGRLENDLRQMAIEMEVGLFEGVIIDDILLGENKNSHIVKCRHKLDGTDFSLTGRWIVDASGRRRLLQTKLGLMKASGHQASAAWWRCAGRIDVDDIGVKSGRRWPKNQVEIAVFFHKPPDGKRILGLAYPARFKRNQHRHRDG